MLGLQSRPFAIKPGLLSTVYTVHSRTGLCVKERWVYPSYSCVSSTLLDSARTGFKYMRACCFENVLKLHVYMSVQTWVHGSVLPSLLDKVLPGQSLNPTSLDLHITPLAGAQPYSTFKHRIQEPHSLSNPDHTTRHRPEVPRHAHGP